MVLYILIFSLSVTDEMVIFLNVLFPQFYHEPCFYLFLLFSDILKHFQAVYFHNYTVKPISILVSYHIHVKSKVKLSRYHQAGAKEERRNGPTHFDLGTRLGYWSAFGPLPRFNLVQIGWASDLVCTEYRGKNPLPLPETEPRLSTLYSDTTLTELSQLLIISVYLVLCTFLRVDTFLCQLVGKCTKQSLC